MRANINGVPDISSNDPFAAPNKKLAGELLQRYLAKLAELENNLEKEQAALIAVKQDEARANHELDTFLQSLIADCRPARRGATRTPMLSLALYDVGPFWPL